MSETKYVTRADQTETPTLGSLNSSMSTVKDPPEDVVIETINTMKREFPTCPEHLVSSAPHIFQ